MASVFDEEDAVDVEDEVGLTFEGRLERSFFRDDFTLLTLLDEDEQRERGV